MRRIILLSILLFALIACDYSDAPTPPPPTGITVEITGLTSFANADVTIRGPNGYELTLTSTTILEDLAPGTYTITARALEFEEHEFTPTPHSRTLTYADGSDKVTVEYLVDRTRTEELLSALNRYRTEAGLLPATYDAEAIVGRWELARYRLLNRTLEAPQPGKGGYTERAAAAYQRRSSGGYGGVYWDRPGPEEYVRKELQSVLTNLAWLDPRKTYVEDVWYVRSLNCGDDPHPQCPTLRNVAWSAYDEHRGPWIPQEPVLFPPDGSTTDLYDNRLSLNNLTPACNWPLGYYGMGVYALFGPSGGRVNVIDSTITANGEELPHCTADSTNVPYSPFIDRGAVVLVPFNPLEPNTTYEVSIATERHGDVAWQFHSGDNTNE